MSYTGTNTTHATFNWNPAYDSYKHVALWGNDTLGDGTKTKPYRTIGKAMSNSTVLNVVIGAGTYREPTFTPASNGAWNLVADGNAIIDVSNNALFTLTFVISGGAFNGVYFRGAGNFISLTTGDPSATFLNCTFENCHFSNKHLGSMMYCSYLNAPAIQGTTSGGSYCSYSYCTFYNSNLVLLPRNNNIFTKNIFSGCNINWIIDGSSAGWAAFTYNNLYNTGQKFPGASTFTTHTTIAGMVAAIATSTQAALFPTTVLNNLYFLDPIFSNPSHGDLSLSFTSPCKNMAYDGTIIGSKSIGLNFVASTNSVTSAFDNSSLVNITIDGTTGALTTTDATQLAQATLKPFSNLLGRNILSLPNFGFFSDRSGQYIDATPDLDLTGTYAAGDTLTDGRIYIVDSSGGQIVYGGNTLAVGDRFTCKSSIATVFSNLSVASYVREIIEGPTRNNIECRFSNGTGTFKVNGDTLTTGYWYYLSSGTASLSSVSYSPGQYIKGDGSAVATSTGIIEEVFTTGGYQYYELFGQITCNRAGNVITGAITKGNGDPSFDRTTANMFKIADKHCQLRYTIQPANLIP